MTNERDQKLIEMESENQYLGSWCHLGIESFPLSPDYTLTDYRWKNILVAMG